MCVRSCACLGIRQDKYDDNCYTRPHTHTRTHTHAHTRTYTYTHTHTHTHTLVHIHTHTHTHLHPPTRTVQDVAFQLERLVAGMYVYYRQCFKIFKPAAIFPIEVELGVSSDYTRQSSEPTESHDYTTVSHDTSHDDSSKDNSLDDLLLPSLALPPSESKPHPPSEVDDLLVQAHDFEP